jgi:HSP20 family protein
LTTFVPTTQETLAMALPFDLPHELSAPLTRLQGGVHRIYDRYRNLVPPGLARVASSVVGWSPAVDLYETPDALVLKADLPGVPASAVELTIEGQILTLRGELPTSGGPSSLRPAERPRGSFSRRIDLGCEVDTDLTRADLRDGVLEVVLPKTRESRSRTIPIRAS